MVSEGMTLAPTAAPGGIAGTGVTAFADVSEHEHQKVAPPPPPETFDAYAKQSEEAGGVMTLMNMLISDLDKDMNEATAEEKNAQADYEAMMKSSAEKRAADSKSYTEKEATKASLEQELEAHTEAKEDAARELAATKEYIYQLHMECDWLMKYFDTRREARASEIDALGQARAVLSGADYSFAQVGVARKFLRHAQ